MACPPDTIDGLLLVAETHPARLALRCAAEQTTYGALVRLSRQYGALFAQHEAPRVLIALPRGRDAYAAMIGA